MPVNRKDFEEASKSLPQYHEEQRQIDVAVFFDGVDRCEKFAIKNKKNAGRDTILACANAYAIIRRGK